MKKTIVLLGAVLTLALAGTAGAALVPGVFDPGSTGCPVATYSGGVLHLEKNCPDATNAAAGADITGLSGQTFTSSSFTLKSTAQCNGGSPRFDIVTNVNTFFLGCNNVTPVVNGDGTATYTFNAATLLAGGSQVPLPTGTISAADVLIDIQGTADLTNITVNGVAEVPVAVAMTKADCKKGGWKTFTDPKFKNQGQCVAYVNHLSKHGNASAQSADVKPAKLKSHKK